jgi:hypothetical protein
MQPAAVKKPDVVHDRARSMLPSVACVRGWRERG